MVKMLHPYFFVLALPVFLAVGLSVNNGWTAATVDHSIYT
jgi:hypothetical protein